jgi:uncharacterized Zn finger protein
LATAQQSLKNEINNIPNKGTETTDTIYSKMKTKLGTNVNDYNQAVEILKKIKEAEGKTGTEAETIKSSLTTLKGGNKKA